VGRRSSMEQVMSLCCDTQAIRKAGREVAALMSRLGAAEAERRIGRPIDDALIGDLVALEVEPNRRRRDRARSSE
jgi:hypothetical protein